MKILEESREHDKVETYKMTKDSAIQTLTHVDDGTQITVESFILYEDTDKDGKSQEILSIMTTDGKVYACVSQTFKDSFDDIFAIFTDEDGKFEPFTISKISGISKSDRKFIDCSLVY